MFKAFKQRRPWAAALVSLFFSPLIGMLYLNRGSLALAYFGLELLSIALAPFLIAHITPNELSWVPALPVRIVGSIHSFLIGRNRRSEEPLHWYAHWYSVMGTFVSFLVAALLIRAFFFQPFGIPSTSMSPSVNRGDYILVSKIAYRQEGPERGDIIVFRARKLDNGSYIKRVVGLPGERIRMRGGILYINGIAAGQHRVADFLENCGMQSSCRVPQFAERLPGGHIDFVLDRIQNGAADNTTVFVVPPDSYFVLGDNRDNSNDSRADMGFIQRSDILGRASRKFVENGHWTWKKIN